MDSTLRRLSLTVQKRLKIGDSRTGKGNSGRKRPKGPPQPQSLIPQFSFPTAKHGAEGEGGFSKGGGDGGGKRGVTASLVDRVTGELIELDGALNGEGWTRLCNREDTFDKANCAGSAADSASAATTAVDTSGRCTSEDNNSIRNSTSVFPSEPLVRIGAIIYKSCAVSSGVVGQMEADVAGLTIPDAGNETSASTITGASTYAVCNNNANTTNLETANSEEERYEKNPGTGEGSISTTHGKEQASPPIAATAATATALTTPATTTGACDVATMRKVILEMDVIFNPPAVTSLECSITLPIVGFPIVVMAEAEFETGVEWEWLREEIAGRQEDVSGARKVGGKKGRNKDQSGGKGFTDIVGTSRMYTPGAADVGRRLMIRCTPLGYNGAFRGRPVVRVLLSPVRLGPEPGALTLRKQWLENTTIDTRIEDEGFVSEQEGDRNCGGVQRGTRRRLRVLCYNILADMYCTSQQADELLYPHCPKEYREPDYRMQMIAREIRGHRADLVMLQECEHKTFERFLMPVMKYDGFQGLYLSKAGCAQEGEALFYRSSALALESSHDFTMSDAIPRLEEFKGLLKAFPFLLTIVEERLTTVAQVAVLRPSGVGAECSSVRLVVANTHLYFHPNAAHIRLMQLVALTTRIKRVRDDLIAQGLTPAVILGGDLNSPPRGPVRYLLGEIIGPDSDLWKNVENFRWGDRFFDGLTSTAVESATPSPSSDEKNREIKGESTIMTRTSGEDTETSSHRRYFLPGVPYLRLELDLILASGFPAFTNFTPSFTETLDYVFIGGATVDRRGNGGEDRLVGLRSKAVLTVEERGGEVGEHKALAVAPMPEEGLLRAMTPGLPSETFPSDHISVVVDLSLVI